MGRNDLQFVSWLKLRQLGLAAVLLAFFLSGVANAGDEKASGATSGVIEQLTTFNEIVLEIDAAPATVWEKLFERSVWMDALVSMETISGEERQVGHLSSIISNVQGMDLARTEEIIVAEENARLILKALTESPTKATTFIDYNLSSLDGDKTKLTLSIYLHTLIPFPEKQPVAVMQAIRAQAEAGTSQKITEDHAKLKALAEAS